jgi:CDGSH-type Zn-finger protein
MVTVTVRPNGPYVVEGDEVAVVDWNGRTYNPMNRVRFALCRCGRSTTKPFCDGTHSRIGFRAAEAAGPAGEEDPA